MFDELKKYEQHSHFFLKRGDVLSAVCNAPTDRSGVYIVYALKNGGIELVYIGRSGEVKGGEMFVRKGGICDRIVNGKQFGSKRRNSWPAKMAKEGMDALDVYWYVTHSDKYVHCPKLLEDELLQICRDIYGQRPRWNRQG